MSHDPSWEEGEMPQGFESPLAFLAKAERLVEVEQYRLALKTLHEGLAAFPDSPEVLGTIAHTHYRADQGEEAEHNAKQALALDPESELAQWVLANCLMDRGQNQEAERVLLEALRQDPDDVDFLLSYARLMYRVGHLKKADQVLGRALQVDPNSDRAHSLRAQVLAEMREEEPSLVAGSMALGLAPGAQHGHFAQGMAYYQAGRPFRARKHMREALRISPGDTDIEEVFLEVDRACRPVYLPMYHFSRWIERLPGNQFLLWGVFVALVYGMDAFGVDERIQMPVIYSYVGFCVYSWIAGPLASLWIRIFPPRI